MERLTAKRAETLRKPGRYQAGDTVYLVVANGRTGRVNKRWVQRLHVQGKRRDISIGTYPAVTLSEARERAHDNRLTAKRGGDPSGRASTVPTFADVSAKVDQGCQRSLRTDGNWTGRRPQHVGVMIRHRQTRSQSECVRGAGVKVASPAQRGRSVATRLDAGEHTPTLSV